MVKSKVAYFARIAPALALLSCVAPKATVVTEEPAPKKDPAATAELAIPVPSLPDDGLRLPEMLAMPGDAEFRATSPNARKSGTEAGTVIVRPPTDPPSRPKPKVPAPE